MFKRYVALEVTTLEKKLLLTGFIRIIPTLLVISLVCVVLFGVSRGLF